MTKISFIAIGNELLKGRVVNTNLAEVGKLLRGHGFELTRSLVIADTPESIEQAVRQELSTHEVVLVSGGLGPTRDDVTKHTLARIFGMKLVEHAESMAHLQARFAKRGIAVTDRNRQQAWVPQGCEVLPNAKGTAPGMLFRQQGHVLISMPGVPFELLHMVEHEVVPRLKAAFPPHYVAQRVLRLTQIPESHAADRMEGIEDTLPEGLSIAYLPRLDGLWLEISAHTSMAQRSWADEQLQAVTSAVQNTFGELVYAGGDASLEALIGSELQRQKRTLAIAESLTGGKVAAKIVSISGSSHYFRGSVTAYHPSIKGELLGVKESDMAAHSVVSAPVAAQMAEGVRRVLNADIGLATTGLAEPEGDRMPCAWLGYADGQQTRTEQVSFLNDRNVNIERATNYALIFCWKNIQQW